MRSMLTLPLVLALSGPAFAADGVLEINQACATQTGCFAGDPAGFPVTITQAGSYRLTGNLVVPANTTAIRIDTENVTLDLGGFAVKGPNACAGYPVTACTTENGAPGISAPTVNEVLAVVRNGRVTGMGGACIDLAGNSSTVEQVAVVNCGNDGIRMGFGGRVAQSVSANSRLNGINLNDGATAEGNEIRGNGSSGISMGSGSLGGGVGGIAIGNRISRNGVFGIANSGLFNFALASKNVFSSNGSIAFSGVRSLGDNLCSGVLC